jgi:hypothetical protein
VSSATCLGINAVDVDNSELVSGHDTSLVKTKSVLLLSFTLVHESFGDVNTFINQTIGLVFDFKFLSFRKTLVMSYIKMSLLHCFFGTGLPNVGTEYFATGSKNNVSARVMSHKLHAAFFVHLTCYFANCNLNIIGDVTVKLVKHTFSDFGHIDNLEITKTFDLYDTCVVHLASRCWVERALVQNYQVAFILHQHIVKDSQALSREAQSVRVSVVEIYSFRQMNCAVQDSFSSFADTLLSGRDFVVKISRDWCFANF